MKRWWVLVLPLVGTCAVVATADADTVTLPGGAALTVSITTPATATTVTAGVPITVAGTASVGDAPAAKNTDLVFVLDTSGSTGSSAGIDCTGDTVVDSRLDCERHAVDAIVAQAQAPRSPIANIGIATFPAGPLLALTSPSNTGAVSTYLAGLAPGGGTDFSVGVSAALQVLSTSTAPQKLIVLLTDGDGTADAEPGQIQAVVLAFTFAGAGCSDADLQRIIAVGLDGSQCEQVTDLGSLSGVIQQTVGSTLQSVQVTVDGGAPVPVVEAAPAPRSLPLGGPLTYPFTASIGSLAAGTHHVCATAAGSDAGGPGQVSSCVDVTALPAGSTVVDCGAVSFTCTAAASDPGRSTLAFSAPDELNEKVVIVPNAGGATTCGGSPCRTGYDVRFPTTSAAGPIASISVVTANKVSIRDILQAAVYIDGKRINAVCSNRFLIRLIRTKFNLPEPIPCATISLQRDGRLEYFVKFAADPAFRFR